MNNKVISQNIEFGYITPRVSLFINVQLCFNFELYEATYGKKKYISLKPGQVEKSMWNFVINFLLSAVKVFL